MKGIRGGARTAADLGWRRSWSLNLLLDQRNRGLTEKSLHSLPGRPRERERERGEACSRVSDQRE